MNWIYDLSSNYITELHFRGIESASSLQVLLADDNPVECIDFYGLHRSSLQVLALPWHTVRCVSNLGHLKQWMTRGGQINADFELEHFERVSRRQKIHSLSNHIPGVRHSRCLCGAVL